MEAPVSTYLNSKALHQRVLYFVDQGMQLKGACKRVGKEASKSWNSIQKHYYKHRGSDLKDHGGCTLTKEQSSILLLIIVVYSLLHQSLSVGEIQGEVKNLFEKDVSSRWARRFLEKHKDEVRLRKTKHLASKRIDNTIVESVAEFVAQVDAILEEKFMRADLVVNYEKI